MKSGFTCKFSHEEPVYITVCLRTSHIAAGARLYIQPVPPLFKSFQSKLFTQEFYGSNTHKLRPGVIPSVRKPPFPFVSANRQNTQSRYLIEVRIKIKSTSTTTPNFRTGVHRSQLSPISSEKFLTFSDNVDDEQEQAQESGTPLPSKSQYTHLEPPTHSSVSRDTVVSLKLHQLFMCERQVKTFPKRQGDETRTRDDGMTG